MSNRYGTRQGHRMVPQRRPGDRPVPDPPATDRLRAQLIVAANAAGERQQERRAARRIWWRRWVWVLVGLVAWALLVLLWATTPSICSLPETHDTAHCQGR
jgi:4-amino-4-deoxy-L-arabinose transferase-like glycosyltransferase